VKAYAPVGSGGQDVTASRGLINGWAPITALLPPHARDADAGGVPEEEDDERCDHGYAGECIVQCECGRGEYCVNDYSSCYDCFLDRRSQYVGCVYCGNWHAPEFDTCFKCRPAGRDDAASDLRRVIQARDAFQCRYCGVRDGDLQADPRLIRPRCAVDCAAAHNHRYPCKPKCGKRHRHRTREEPGNCGSACAVMHAHRVKDDDGIRNAKLHVDHIQPCAKAGTADPWNLQTLCGVCNIAKGADWVPWSRHHLSRRLIMAAYLTYLADFLTEDQRRQLGRDAAYEELTYLEAVSLITSDYVRRVKSRRPRPPAARLTVIEDVPALYSDLGVVT
jgi:5-methylcytosine-specific restriction endonuclease McrA